MNSLTGKITCRPIALGLLALAFSALLLGRAQAGGSHFYPPVADAVVRDECGSCHLAYPPTLLGANDWRQLMGKLDSHFGSDAAVNPEIGQKLTAFLVTNAGQSNKLEGAGNPPRISQTTHFVKEHRKIPARYWTDTRVRSAANCEACHTDAASGRFSEHDIAIADLRR